MKALLPVIAAWYLRLLRATNRYEVIGQEIPEKFWNSGKPFVLAFWHGQLFLVLRCWQTDMPVHQLMSRNHDGELMSSAVTKIGIGAVRGSSNKKGKNKGGLSAIRDILKTLKSGECVGLTPDGPKGPRMHAKEGFAVIAKMSGVPVIPVVAAARWQVRAKSWDRLSIALPFSRAVIMWGDPVYVARDADENTVEAARQQVQDNLNTLSIKACDHVGCDNVEPGEAPA